MLTQSKPSKAVATNSPNVSNLWANTAPQPQLGGNLFLAMVTKNTTITSIALVDESGKTLLNKQMTDPKKGKPSKKMVDIFSVWYELAPLIKGKQVYFENANSDTYLISKAMAKGFKPLPFAALKSGCTPVCLGKLCAHNALVKPKLVGTALERAKKLQALCKPLI